MLTSLSITTARSQIAQKMISTTDAIAGYEVKSILGPVESVIEKGYSRATIPGIGVVEGGGLFDMVFDAKQAVAIAAHELGANAVVGFRYALCGRELEQSLIAYGTAVYAEKKE